MAPWLGRWLSADPIFLISTLAAQHAGDRKSKRAHSIDLAHQPNVYLYVLANPINLHDPDGAEPTKEKVGTLANLVGHVQALENKYSKQGLSVREANERILPSVQNKESYLIFNELRNVTPNGKTLSLSKLKADRYIYTREGGWIDMSHFAAAAGKTAGHNILRHLPYADLVAYMKGMQEEEKQSRDPKAGIRASAYSFEDMPSNMFGFEFGKIVDFDKPLSPQLQNFFRGKLGGDINPKKVGNWLHMPNWDKDTVGKEPLQNRTEDPVFFPVAGEKTHPPIVHPTVPQILHRRM